MTNPVTPLRNNQTPGQRYFFDRGARVLKPQQLDSMTDREVRELGREDLRHSLKQKAIGTALVGALVGSFAGVIEYDLHRSAPLGPINNGPEPRLSDDQISEQMGGVSSSTQQKIAEQHAIDEETRQSSATSIHPVHHR